MKKLAIVLTLVLVLAATVTVFAACGEEYDLVYACWNLGTDAEPTVEEYMIRAFEEAHDVKIKRMNYPSGYDDAIKAAVARGDAPDVFMISNLNYVLNNEYALDISQYAQADDDWQEIPASLEQSAHYKSSIYAVPFAMHMQGFFVNVDLLKKNNLTVPEDFTYEWLTQQAFPKIKTIDAESPTKAKALNSEASFFEWYPSAANSEYGMFTWDGSEYHLNSDEFKTGLAQAKEIRRAGYSYDSLSQEERDDDFGGAEINAAFNQGRIAFRYGYSFEAPDMFKNVNNAFEIRFVGIPYVSESKSEHKRTERFSILIPDYTSIYKGTKNPELAFEFAKWMGYGPEGITKRIELAAEGETAADRVPNTLPMTTDPTVVEKYFDVYPVDGVKEMYDKLDNAVMEPTKIVPGYQGARWNATTGQSVVIIENGAETTVPNANMGQFLDACWNGISDVEYSAALAESCNTLANKQYANTVAKYENKYN